VAGCLQNKLNEPPLIAVAEDGSAVVPLLGGHHGANDLAHQIADILGISPAVTTAGDLRFGIALDEPPEGFVLSNPEDVKHFTAELLSGEYVSLSSGDKQAAPDYMQGFYKWLRDSRMPFSENAKLRISLAVKPISGNAEHLVFQIAPDFSVKNIVIGVGCERGTDPEELIALVRKTLQENDISPERVAVVVSLDLKADEPAVHAVAKNLECSARFFDVATLEALTPKLKNPSEIVFQEVGCHGVAEGAALAAVGDSGILLVSKVKSSGMPGAGRATCAIAESAEFLDPQMIGRAQGTLFIVGTGPGTPEWRLPESEKMLRKATDWVGYGLYLDLISDLHNGQKQHRFDLGQEEVRVRHALKLAAQGKTVALISSGDPGIYGMAGLIFEILAESGWDPKTGLQVVIVPGVSALNSCASVIGSPLMTDFAVVSMSDLLVPWEIIVKRVEAAAAGDFVIVIYNPSSKKRIHQLQDTRKLLLEHRSPNTPVAIIKGAYRESQSIVITDLENLMEYSDKLGMISTVIVGNSSTYNFNDLMINPRGYKSKYSLQAQQKMKN